MWRWVFEELVTVSTIDVSEGDTEKQIPRCNVHCDECVLFILQIPENKDVWITTETTEAVQHELNVFKNKETKSILQYVEIKMNETIQKIENSKFY